ncbi:MAG: GNAT family N-acetyltransferase [Defluviitaleaceae bacterium]|nr:GNAT family N-acetyltransferase [Defluviitaleaceae bacterium]
MEQLIMTRGNNPPREVILPDGYGMRAFKDGDETEWCLCCMDGELGVGEASEKMFDEKMRSDPSVDLSRIYFLTKGDEVAGTVTFQNKGEENEAYIHMVAIKKEYRGLGLSSGLINYALGRMREAGVKRVLLTTDSWRLAAIKTYLNCGFVPLINDGDVDTTMRWYEVLEAAR